MLKTSWFNQNDCEEMSLREFLMSASQDIKQACEEAELSDGRIISSDSADLNKIEEFVKDSKKLKEFGQGTVLYESSDGFKFVYHAENGSVALYMK